MDFLFIDFLNSEYHDWRGSGKSEDRFNDSKWIEIFLSKWGFEAITPHIETHKSLIELRTHMRSIIESMSRNEPPNMEDLQIINRSLAMLPSSYKLNYNGEKFILDPYTESFGWPLIMGSIALSFSQLLVDHRVQRVKICANDDCQWIFFDNSKNKARIWCDDKACGNLIKVRRFRERQKIKSTD